jgi:hypothetical protein
MRIITCTSFNHIQLLSPITSHCAYQKWHLHLKQCCHFWPNKNKFTSQSCIIQKFVTSNATQAKEMNYHNWQPIDQFLHLTIEIFGCSHKHANVFLHDCGNAIWSLKVPEGLHISTLVTFLCQKISITLQRMQVSSILNWAVVVGLAISWLPSLQNTPPITTVDLLQVISFWHINMVNLLQAIDYGHGEIFTPTLNQLDVLSLLPFPSFFSFVHFPNLRRVFLIKVYKTLMISMFLLSIILAHWWNFLSTYWCKHSKTYTIKGRNMYVGNWLW